MLIVRVVLKTAFEDLLHDLYYVRGIGTNH
jgi:hypothetical protein